MTEEAREQRKALRRIKRPLLLGEEVVRILDAAIIRELAAAYSRGYAEGHEQQMQMRILDRKECEATHGKKPFAGYDAPKKRHDPNDGQCHTRCSYCG